jgi:hypothetical protein
MIEKNIKDLNIKFIGESDWKKFRNFLILKLQEADSEDKFVFLMETIIGSMFRSTKEIDQTRKKLNLEMLSKKEKKEINS